MTTCSSARRPRTRPSTSNILDEVLELSPGSHNVPTVYFDLSEGAAISDVSERRQVDCDGGQEPEVPRGGALLASSRLLPSSTSSRSQDFRSPGGARTSGPSDVDPAVLHHYGALLCREQAARQRVEEELYNTRSELRGLQDRMLRKDQESEEEKLALLELLERKDQELELQRALAEDASKSDVARLKERVKQLNLFQKSLLKQVSSLIAEREELKRLVERQGPSAPLGRRRVASAATLGATTPRGRSMSSAAATIAAATLRQSPRDIVISPEDLDDEFHSAEASHTPVDVTCRPFVDEDATAVLSDKQNSRDALDSQQQHLQELLQRQCQRRGYPTSLTTAERRSERSVSPASSSGCLRRSQSAGRAPVARPLEVTPPRGGYVPSFSEIMALPLQKDDEPNGLPSPKSSGTGQKTSTQGQFMDAYARHINAYQKQASATRSSLK